MCFIVSLNSCDTATDQLLEIETEKENVQTQTKEDKNFINHENAISIALDLQFPVGKNNLSKTKDKIFLSNKKISDTKDVKDDSGTSVFYVINYQEGGFVILSADKRIEPVLAFSSTSSFPVDSEFYPSGLVDWLSNQRDRINYVRKVGSKETYEICDAQRFITPSMNVGKCVSSCDNKAEIVNPLLTTTWGQRDFFNDALNPIGCTEDGRPPVGCVAVAMGQIMRFYQQPINYNWREMPANDNRGTMSAAILLRDIGTEVDMDYDCDGSGADTEREVASSFTEDFGYSSASYANFNHQTVMRELRFNRPVILKGGKKDTWFIFPIYADGHAWVCDGFVSWFDCKTGKGFVDLHMNWGWYGRFNGHYLLNNWNPNGGDFNYRSGMVHNIRP